MTDPESILAAPKQNVPMLQISLQYKSITGKLTVEIIKGRHMKTLNVQKAPGKVEYIQWTCAGIWC